MIRKALIVTCLVLALASAAVWAGSRYSAPAPLIESKTSPPAPPTPAPSQRFLLLRVSEGTLWLSCTRLNACAAGTGWDWHSSVGFSYRRFYCLPNSTIGRTVIVPLWAPTVAFAAYPVPALLFGPALRRRRRRKRGLCVECGYDLTGNVTGICSECGSEIEQP